MALLVKSFSLSRGIPAQFFQMKAILRRDFIAELGCRVRKVYSFSKRETKGDGSGVHERLGCLC